MTASIHQLAVLEWLIRHPGLTVNGKHFSAGWRNAEAKEHMLATVTVLGPNPLLRTDEVRGGYLTADATPKCARATFRALRRREWLKEVDTGADFPVGGWRPTKAGTEAYFRHRARFRGQKIRLQGESTSRPRTVGPIEIKRRGGPEAARFDLRYHRRVEANHKRIADHIEESLRLLSVEQRAWPESMRGMLQKAENGR